MSVNSAALLAAIVTAWNAADLDNDFTALWESSVTDSEYTALNDTEAAPTQPFPYCVYEQAPGGVDTRMSGHDATERHEIRNIPITFNVHARTRDGDGRTAKEIAATLAEEITKVFGGHPTQAPAELTVDNGGALPTQYITDYGVKTDDNEYQWVINYLFRIDAILAA